MMTPKSSPQRPVSVSTYLLLAGVSLVAAIAVGYYYLHYMRSSGTEKMDDRVFYLVLILFGMAASALIFGIMNSYASLKGIQSNVTYKFTGPVVGVILTVLGGFLIPKGSSDQILSVRVFDTDSNPVTKGHVTLTFPHYQREGMIDEKGMAVFPEIPFDQLRNRIIINVVSDGYATLNIDTLLTSFEPVRLTVTQSKVIQVMGKVIDAAERPIKDVEVVIDGTPFSSVSKNDGSFRITLPDYHFGDRITLVTSHPGYEDKEKEFNIQSGEINNIEIVLNPLPVQTDKPRHK